MTIEEIVDKHWDEMFEELIKADCVGDDLWELLIEVRTASDGVTIRRSWKDRNEMLREDTN